MVLDSPCAFLEAEGAFLMAITAQGSLSVWNTTLRKSIFPPLSVSSLLSSSATPTAPHPTITTSSLLPNGAPLLALSSGSTHTYDADLMAWTRVCEPWWSTGSTFWEARRNKTTTAGGRGVIRQIESAVNEVVVDAKTIEVDSSSDDSSADEDDDDEGEADDEEKSGDDSGEEGDESMADGDDNDQKGKAKARSKKAPKPKRDKKKRKTVPTGEEQEEVGDKEMFSVAVSLAHLEVRMKAAVSLDSPSEYRTFLLAYAKKLSEEGIKGKAEELCKELLGPVY